MKRIFLFIPALCLTFSVACDSGDRRAAQSEGYQETDGLIESETGDSNFEPEADNDFNLERTTEAGLEEATFEFVNEAAISSMLEVELAEIAREKASESRVKDYAGMIEKDHQQANQNLRNIAAQENINLPENLEEDQQEKMQQLQNLSGNEFDKEYIIMMVDLHQKDVERFENIQDQVEDPNLKSWVDNTLVVLREHLEQAQQIKDLVVGS